MFKVSWLYEQKAGDRTGGWTENYWWNGDQVDAAKLGAAALFKVLDRIHGNRSWASHYRLSNPEVFRKAQEFPTGIGGPSTSTKVFPDTDYPTISLLLETESPSGFSRQWIRGIPDEVTTEGGRYTPTSVFKQRLNAFIKELKSGDRLWSRRLLNQANQLKPVTAIDITTGIVTCSQHGMGANGSTFRVRIKGFQTQKSVNKVWRATVIDADTFNLAFFQPLTGEPAVGDNPTARKQEYIPEKITGARIVRTTSHKTGRPTGLLSGQSPKKNK